jgi:DNA-binding transcriptional regulator YiaG
MYLSFIYWKRGIVVLLNTIFLMKHIIWNKRTWVWEPACSTPLAIPFSELTNTVALPDKRTFPETLSHIGSHIKQVRLERSLPIKEVIEQLNIDRETLRCWESGTYEPHVYHYPTILTFLGYDPLQIDTTTLAGKIKRYRYIHGLSQEKMAEILQTDRSTVWQWETNLREPIPVCRERILKLVGNM